MYTLVLLIHSTRTVLYTPVASQQACPASVPRAEGPAARVAEVMVDVARHGRSARRAAALTRVHRRQEALEPSLVRGGREHGIGGVPDAVKVRVGVVAGGGGTRGGRQRRAERCPPVGDGLGHADVVDGEQLPLPGVVVAAGDHVPEVTRMEEPARVGALRRSAIGVTTQRSEKDSFASGRAHLRHAGIDEVLDRLLLQWRRPIRDELRRALVGILRAHVSVPEVVVVRARVAVDLPSSNDQPCDRLQTTVLSQIRKHRQTDGRLLLAHLEDVAHLLAVEHALVVPDLK